MIVFQKSAAPLEQSKAKITRLDASKNSFMSLTWKVRNEHFEAALGLTTNHIKIISNHNNFQHNARYICILFCGYSFLTPYPSTEPAQSNATGDSLSTAPSKIMIACPAGAPKISKANASLQILENDDEDTNIESGEGEFSDGESE